MDNVIIPKDFTEAVADIKLAILQARSEAARTSNKEALKLYFFVGGYISLKTRTARWGTGAICALSKRLQIELPGLRGFSPQHIRFMRQFYEEWNPVLGLANQGCSEKHYLPSSERDYCHLQDGNSIRVHSWFKCFIIFVCFVVQMISLFLKNMSVNSQAISLERMDLSRRNGRIPTNEMPFSSV